MCRLTDLHDFVRRLPEYSQGRADANADIAKGKLAQRDFQPSLPWWAGAVRLLETLYEIETEFVDVHADKGLIARSIGYNDRMREYAISVFGSDVFQAAFEAAERDFQELKDR